MNTSPDGKRTALVTGANSGLGKAITVALAADGMRVGLVVRDRVRGESALEEIRAATGNEDLHLTASPSSATCISPSNWLAGCRAAA
jgi:NAD(P)-dependent dehydrogenase (short-subunit alcohol dehydrogenase family)